jgi:cell division transport system permease protein
MRIGVRLGPPRGVRAADRALPRRPPSARSLAAIGAVLGFLAVIALGLVLAGGRLEATWSGGLAEQATLQVFAPATEVETQARAALAVLRTTPGIRSVRMVEVAEQRALLEPWLGADSAIENLPLPLLIDVGVERNELDRAGLDRRLAEAAPGAAFDDHTAWRAPLVASAGRLRAFALACLGLLALAFAAALAIAGHAAIAASAPAIATLRLVGTRDGAIARALTGRLTRQATLGAGFGAAAGAGLLAFLPQASESGFFLIGIGLGGWQRALPLLVPVAAVALAWVASAQAVRRGLRRRA